MSHMSLLPYNLTNWCQGTYSCVSILFGQPADFCIFLRWLQQCLHQVFHSRTGGARQSFQDIGEHVNQLLPGHRCGRTKWTEARQKVILLHCLGTKGQQIFYILPDTGTTLATALTARLLHTKDKCCGMTHSQKASSVAKCTCRCPQCSG